MLNEESILEKIQLLLLYNIEIYWEGDDFYVKRRDTDLKFKYLFINFSEKGKWSVVNDILDKFSTLRKSGKILNTIDSSFNEKKKKKKVKFKNTKIIRVNTIKIEDFSDKKQNIRNILTSKGLI